MSDRSAVLNVSVVVGNPKPGSRTLGVANAIAEAVVSGLKVTAGLLVVDLAEYAGEIFDPNSEALRKLTDSVASSDLLIVASPTFKASYTGLLKSFFDRYGSNALAGVVAIPVMTGAAPVHTLALEVHLRPLLTELGASTPSQGLYVTESQFPNLDAIVRRWASEATPRISASVPVR
ncbi:MAG: NAD(P)H-dependent oxidoreductase [Acidimicrobiales bacterium]